MNNNAYVQSGSDIEIGRDGAVSNADLDPSVWGSEIWGGIVEMNNSSRMVTGANVNIGSGGGSGKVIMRDNAYMEGNNFAVMGDASKFAGIAQDHAEMKFNYFQLRAGADNTTATFIFKDDATATFGGMAIGRDANGTGRKSLLTVQDRAALTVNGIFAISQYATDNTAIFKDSATLAARELLLGHWSGGSNATMEIKDDAVVTVSDAIWLARDWANGKLLLTEKGQLIVTGANADIILSTNTQDRTNGGGGTGEISLRDDASITTAGGDVIIGQIGAGTLNVSGTADLVVGGGGDLYIGGDGRALVIQDQRNPTGTFNISGNGVVDVAGGKVIIGSGKGYEPGLPIYDNGDGTWTTNVTGTPVMNGDAQRVTPAEDITGTANLNGGTVATQGFEKGNARATATLNLNGATIEATADNADFFAGFNKGEVIVGENGIVLDTNGHAITITTDLVGEGVLDVIGDGTFTLTGDLEGFTGAVKVDNGSVTINATVLNIVLDGVNATTNNAGANAANAYAASGTGALVIGNVTLNVLLSTPEAITASGEYIYNVFTGNVTVGNVTINSTTDASFSYEWLGNGQLKLTAVIPEPSTYALVGAAGLFGLAALRRRRK